LSMMVPRPDVMLRSEIPRDPDGLSEEKVKPALLDKDIDRV